MKKTQEIILLFIIGIADAYMVSHPNLLGKIGVRVYNYSMFKTFPNALLTILGALTFSYVLCLFLQKKTAMKWAKYVLIFCLVLSISTLIQVFLKFSGGSYAHTGKVFKFGLHLFPILLIYIFGNGLWVWIRNSRTEIK
jgi:hypothetical protein